MHNNTWMNKEIKKIIKNEVLIFKKEKNNFFFTSNDTNWIFDFRRAFLQWKFLWEFSSFFWNKYENEFPFQVWWLESWAIPFISGIIMEWLKRWKNINSFFIRKERKKSWLWNKIEGKLNNEKIIIVDDLFNSWKSIGNVYESLKREGKNIYKIFTFVNFWNEKWRNFLEKNNLILEYEFSLIDFWLDIFWNSIDYGKEEYRNPIIFPEFQKIFVLENANRFIEVPKSSPIKLWKNIYFGWEWWKFVSICSDTWKINWDFSVNIVEWHKNILSTPKIIDNNIVFGSYDWNLYCLNIETWKINWKSFCAEWIGSSPTYSKKYNQIYIWLELWSLNNKWSLAWIDFVTWKKKWENFYNDYVHCSPWYSEKLGVVICWWNDWKLSCVRWDNWKLLFERNFNNPIKWGFAFSYDWKIAYFWCFDNNLYALNLITWKIQWSYQTGNIIYTTPIVIWNNIFFGSLDKYFYHLDNKGNLIKKIRTFWKIFSKPIIISKNLLAFGSNDGYIYFYNFVDRKVIFVIEHKERINTNLIYDKKFKHLYVYDFLNSIFRYNLHWFIN